MTIDDKIFWTELIQAIDQESKNSNGDNNYITDYLNVLKKEKHDKELLNGHYENVALEHYRHIMKNRENDIEWHVDLKDVTKDVTKVVEGDDELEVPF